MMMMKKAPVLYVGLEYGHVDLYLLDRGKSMREMEEVNTDHHL